jgi:hypothetical protein
MVKSTGDTRTLYQDHEPFSLTCPGCESHFEEKVGRLKTGVGLQCPACGRKLRYEVKKFLAAVGYARRGFGHRPGNILIIADEPPDPVH